MMDVQVKGLSELGEALKMFGDEIGAKHLKAAAFACADVIKEDAITRAPVLKEIDDRRIAGALRDAIAVFKRPSPNAETVHYAVGIRRIKINAKIKRVLKTLNLKAARGSGGDVFYGHLMEFGYHDHAGKWHEGTRFMTKAFEAKKNAALEAFSLRLSQGVVSAVLASYRGK